MDFNALFFTKSRSACVKTKFTLETAVTKDLANTCYSYDTSVKELYTNDFTSFKLKKRTVLPENKKKISIVQMAYLKFHNTITKRILNDTSCRL